MFALAQKIGQAVCAPPPWWQTDGAQLYVLVVVGTAVLLLLWIAISLAAIASRMD